MENLKLVKTNKNIKKGIVYKFNKIVDKYIEKFLAQENESIEDAKIRIAKEMIKTEYAIVQPIKTIKSKKTYSTNPSSVLELKRKRSSK